MSCSRFPGSTTRRTPARRSSSRSSPESTRRWRWAACADFLGPARRFQILGEVDGVAVVDDYAHHPTEVAAAIDAARQRYPAAA